VAAARPGPPPLPAERTPSPSASLRPGEQQNVNCTTVPLPMTEGEHANTDLVVDPTGVYIATTLKGPSGLIIWKNGAQYGDVKAGTGLVATGVNASGTVSAYGRRDGHDVPYRGDRTTVTELRLPAGAVSGRAYGINAAGDIVGEATFGPGNYGAVLWPGNDPLRPRLLPTPDGMTSGAHGIADDGRIVGELNDGAVAVLWPVGGTVQFLAPPPGALPGAVARSITGDWVFGEVHYLITTVLDPQTARRVPYQDDVVSYPPVRGRWDLRTGSVEVVGLGGSIGHVVDGDSGTASAAGITRDGTVVLGDVGAANVNGPGRPSFLRVEGEAMDPSGISADGHVLAGGAVHRPADPVPATWTCG
jgi:hypothetical protein